MLCLHDSVPKKWIPSLDEQSDEQSDTSTCKYCLITISGNHKLCDICSIHQNCCVMCGTKLVFDKASCLSFLQVLVWHLGRAKLKVNNLLKNHYENQIEKIRMLIIDVANDKITSYNELGICFWADE